MYLKKLWNASFVEQKRLKRNDSCYNKKKNTNIKDNYGRDNPSYTSAPSSPDKSNVTLLSRATWLSAFALRFAFPPEKLAKVRN